MTTHAHDRFTRTLVLTIATLVMMSLSLTSSAFAKDVHNQISDLIGIKLLRVVTSPSPQLSSSSPPKKKKGSQGQDDSASFQLADAITPQVEERWVEFVYLGHTELVVIDEDGAWPVHTTFGGSDFSWEDDQGRQYTIEAYPYDNDHAQITGRIYDGPIQVGILTLNHFNVSLHAAAGAWVGELAFAGGASLPLSLRVAEKGHSYGGCTGHPTRIDFPGQPYASADLTSCEESPGAYSANFFYLDPRHGDRWFVSISGSVSPEGDYLQGSAWLLKLSGEGGSAEGYVSLQRPTRFSLID